MKKINYICIFIVLSLSFITLFLEIDKGLVTILKDSGIILTIFAPYIFSKVSKIDIDESLKFIWIVFIFLSHYLGVICNFYDKFYYFDKVTHTMSGVLSGSVALLILDKAKSKNFVFNVLFIIAFTWLCAGLWEVFEFSCSVFLDVDPQKVSLTGVSDTMWDMIVAFLGSILVSIAFYFKRSD